MNRWTSCLLMLALAGIPGVTAAAGPIVTPEGELAARIGLIRERILTGQVPALTPDFILADVALRPDYPRRFSNFSGDVSGRFIGALAYMPLEGVNVDDIVRATIGYQKPDGRFGDANLVFTPDKIGPEHMALLWGNGRLLAGLLEYNAVKPDAAVLDSSRKLGDFLRSVYTGCANEEVINRVKDMAANGPICFTQLIEGLVMLGQATGDKTYIDCAESIIPWFPQDRGHQHSHGYLSTLRGIVMLYEATGKPEHLALVENLYGSLVNSSDYTPYGGVNEYFGPCDRDEGCSEADFLRLSLQLWRVTGKLDYLQRAEHILVNQFSTSQFPSGDFGHHGYTAQGFIPLAAEGRAWWCCTWHGLRAYRDVLDSIATDAAGTLRVNLFQDATWSDGARAVSLRWSAGPAGAARLAIQVGNAPAEGLKLAIRKPAWATDMTVTVPSHEEQGYLVLDQPLKTGERLEAAVTLAARIVQRNGEALALEQVTDTPVEGMLVYGPWILGVSGAENTAFYGEPWAANKVMVPAALSGELFDVSRTAPGVELPVQYPTPAIEVPGTHLWLRYTHDGFPGTYDVLLRPISERTACETKTMACWLNYRKAVQ